MNKIDLIIDALRLGFSRCPAREMGHFEQALAAARKVRELKPVGIRYNYFGTVVSPFSDGLFDRLEKYPDIELQKLYALDEVTK
jgi:hypothetical protein